MIGVWLVGGALAFAGAMAYAELAALRPRAGGEYVYLREAFGPLAAFLTGWTSFVAGFSGAIAASAVALADYVGRFIPAVADMRAGLLFARALAQRDAAGHRRADRDCGADRDPRARSGSGTPRPERAGGNQGDGAIVLLVALGFAIGRGHIANIAAPGDVGPVSFLLALVPVMFSYSGWNAAAYVAEEVRDPGRNVPLALGLGTVDCRGAVRPLNALYVYAMPVSALAALPGGRLMDIDGRAAVWIRGRQPARHLHRSSALRRA